MLNQRLAGILGEALGAEVVSARPVAGGDVNKAYRVKLADRRVVFAKTHPSPPAGFFTTEALGLEWLRKADAIAVPATLAYADTDADDPDADAGPGFLAMEWIEEGSVLDDSDAEFGRQLARLHGVGAPTFGREDRRTTSSRKLPNEPCPTWAEFYCTQRLGPLRRLATDAAALPASALAGIDRVIGRIDFLVGPSEPAARLPLHQLAPLVVHAIKFGGHYIGRVEQALLQLR